MSWIRTLWSLIIEPLILVFVVGVSIKIFVTNSKRIELYTEKMWESTKKSQVFLQQIDHEFDVMNMCAKSIKRVFFNFGKIYKEISEGTKTVDEAIREAKNSMPEDIKSNLSGFFLLTEESGTESTAQSQGMYSSSDFDICKSKHILSDSEKPSAATLKIGGGDKAYDLDTHSMYQAEKKRGKKGGTVREVKG